MVINPLGFASFRDPSLLVVGPSSENLFLVIKLIYVEDLGTDQHHKAQLDACRMAKRNLGFLLFLLISPLKALPGAKPLAKSDPGEKKQNTSQ